jgi:hypothetical protein
LTRGISSPSDTMGVAAIHLVAKVNCFAAADRLRLQGDFRYPTGAHRGCRRGRRKALRPAARGLDRRGPAPRQRPGADHRAAGLRKDGHVRARRSAQAHRTPRCAPAHGCRAEETLGGCPELKAAAPTPANAARKKRRLTPEGRTRIIAATKRRRRRPNRASARCPDQPGQEIKAGGRAAEGGAKAAGRGQSAKRADCGTGWERAGRRHGIGKGPRRLARQVARTGPPGFERTVAFALDEAPKRIVSLSACHRMAAAQRKRWAAAGKAKAAAAAAPEKATPARPNRA